MATSLLLWHSSNQKTGSEEEHENNVTEEEETRPENVKQKGRKGGKSKGTSQKKQPQRGLGVAQLERLRLQERWKKITVVDQVQTQKHCNQFPFSYIDQPNGVSVPTSVRSGPVNYGAFIDGQSSSKQAFGFHPYRLGNSGFHGSGGGSGMRAMFSDQLSTDRHQISVQEARHQNGNLFQASKELSSTKKKHCLSDHCEICFKKKRINGENMEYNGGRGKYSETMPIDGCDFLALNLGRSKTIDGESRDFSARGARRAASPGLNADKMLKYLRLWRGPLESSGIGDSLVWVKADVASRVSFVLQKVKAFESVEARKPEMLEN
ncbi:hypothetical protein HHK36_023741 [Tetracentron sinense]|uniref:Uncharacterized protein n=1 Tax=Tetracentron sinense TaxID=13715 RepID=A0A834YQS4_TETSI|nr:hypothetical protein HHK36_023741 [Tetracentron sinense]